MIPPEAQDVARRGEELYQQRLRGLEQTQQGQFLAIEPDSGDYFLGRTLEEAIRAARHAYASRMTYTCRIGDPAAVEIGFCSY